MAFVTTQTSVTNFGGNTPSLVLVTGTYSLSGGDTTGVIAPGYTNASGVFTAAANGGAGLTSIVGANGSSGVGGYVSLTPNASDATQAGGVTSFNVTLSRVVFNLTATANSTGTYQMFCLNNGSQP